MIEIDGSFGEGGGQVLRTALTLSVITNVHVIRQFLPVEIEIVGEEGGPGAVTVTGADWGDTDQRGRTRIDGIQSTRY